MHGVGERPGWVWIFILEGLFTVVCGLLSFFLLPRSPAHARFFNACEKDYVIVRLRRTGLLGKMTKSMGLAGWRLGEHSYAVHFV
jgi:hypothetical protein